MRLRHVSTQPAPLLVQVGHFRAVRGRPVELGVARGFFRNGDLEARPEVLQLLLVELLLLVGDVAALARLAQPVAFDGVGQDHGGPVLGFHGRFVGVVDLARIVAAAPQLHQLVVAQVRHQVQQLGVLAEEVFADVGAVLGDVGLVLAVHRFAHALLEQAGGVAGQQRVPIFAPDHLDDVPARAAEGGFQLLNHLAVAAHRPVQPLQVAVDDEGEVVQLFARGQGQRAHGFRLVHFAIAQEAPDSRGVGGMSRGFPGTA
jgi:hypothetical protein